MRRSNNQAAKSYAGLSLPENFQNRDDERLVRDARRTFGRASFAHSNRRRRNKYCRRQRRPGNSRTERQERARSGLGSREGPRERGRVGSQDRQSQIGDRKSKMKLSPPSLGYGVAA